MGFDDFVMGYIDPVSGTLIIQVIIAAIVGTIGFFRKSIWNSIAWIFGRHTPDAGNQRSQELEGEEIEQ